MMEDKNLHNKAVYSAKESEKAQKYILIIEDDAFTKKDIGSALIHKYQRRTVASIKEALRLLDEGTDKVDLIITTHKLDNSTEQQIWDMVEKIKANENLKHIPIIMQRETYRLSAATKANIAGFITKPYYSCDIAELVKKVLGE